MCDGNCKCSAEKPQEMREMTYQECLKATVYDENVNMALGIGMTYADVYMVPKFGILESRAEANTGIILGNHSFQLPVIPANMECVIGMDNAKWMSEYNYFYIYHRFGDQKAVIRQMNEEDWWVKSISIGVKTSDIELLNWVIENNYRIDFLTIDIAHGHSVMCTKMIEKVKDIFINSSDEYIYDCPVIIAGNVATSEGAIALYEAGADVVKVGVGPGGNCSSKNVTAMHVPMFTCALEVSLGVSQSNYRNYPIILDGGIRESGDIVKALCAYYKFNPNGSAFVMAGSYFGACEDSSAQIIWNNELIEWPIAKNLLNQGIGYECFDKVMYGSASAYNSAKKDRRLEGFKSTVKMKESYAECLLNTQYALQSAISYAGGREISNLGLANFRIINQRY